MTDTIDTPAGALAEAVEPRISYVVARLERAVRAAVNERVRPHGLTTLQYTTLSVLGARGRPLQRPAGAPRVHDAPVDDRGDRRAGAQGLIRRDPHPSHRRVFPATMTAKGRRVATACDAAVEEMEEEMLAGLSSDERESLLAWLKTCVRALHAGFPSSRAASRRPPTAAGQTP